MLNTRLFSSCLAPITSVLCLTCWLMFQVVKDWFLTSALVQVNGKHASFLAGSCTSLPFHRLMDMAAEFPHVLFAGIDIGAYN